MSAAPLSFPPSSGSASASERAALSKGASNSAIHQVIRKVVKRADRPAATLLDIGCGSGNLSLSLSGLYLTYIGCDLVLYDGFPTESWAAFVKADLNYPPYPIESGAGDIVVAAETIEHLENPRAFLRELVRLTRPGGLVLVTTPNQLSLLSKGTLLLKNEFDAFDPTSGHYPAHITALLEGDLRRIADESGLQGVTVCYTGEGRIPFSSRTWPSRLGLRGRWFSDNVLMSGVKPSPAPF
jgi:SAM-dependent methyltransferase